MKHFLFLFACALFPASGIFAQVFAKTQTDAAADNLKGNVKSVTQNYYQVVQTKAGKDSVGQQWEMTDRNYVITYNDKGYIMWAAFYKTGSVLDYRYEYKYDAGGNRIQETWFDADNALDYRLTRKFSAKGFLMELKKYTDTTGECDEKTVYDVDPTGNALKATLYDGSDAVIQVTTYKYDEYGNKIEEDNIDAKGKPLGKIIYTYDNRHLKKSEDTYTGVDVLMTKKKFVYEYRGRLSQQQNFDEKGTLVEKNIFEYNDQADPTIWTNFNRNGSVAYNYSYTYEVDAQGNWVKQYQLQDGKVVFVSTREISYY
jgi:YD repeat-containing protein